MRDPDFTLSAGPTMAYRACSPRSEADHLPLRPSWRRSADRAQAGGDIPHQERHPAHAGRGGARARGGRPRARQPGSHASTSSPASSGRAWATGSRTSAPSCTSSGAYNDSVDPADERYLDEHPEIDLVTVVHSETPSGTLHDLAAIGPIARAHGAMTIVDCVSSLGGIEFRTDEWQVDIAVAAAQKCLGGPPGISLTVNEAAWERVGPIRRAPRPSSPCSTGRSGSTAGCSRSHRPSSTCTGSRRAATSSSRRVSTTRSPGTISLPAPAVRA